MSTEQAAELPVVAWRTIVRVRALDVIYHYAETSPEGDDLTCEWQLLTDHATATAQIAALRAELEKQPQQVADLAMTVRMLCSKLKKHEPDSHLVKSAMAYQMARGLSSPLRDAAMSTDQAEKGKP